LTTFVLVHGAWHGGWCWRFVAPALRRAGHDVYTPTLTGLGERQHLAHPGIDLDLHIQDVVGLIEMEDLHDIVLVGHSYGGMVVTGVADRCIPRIRHLLYLDAFVPENGKSLMDYALPARVAAYRQQGAEVGSIATPPLAQWGIVAPEHVAFVQPRETRQPFHTFAQPLRLANEAALARLRKTYVYCASPPTGSFNQFAAKCRADPAWKFHELQTGHDAMILVPDEVVRILLDAR
jgi:pimeloyl-ACP methyl ester carboxylesterase